MPKLDPFGSTDKLDNSLLDVMAKRLEVRGVHPFFQQALADYLDAMNIEARARGARSRLRHRPRRPHHRRRRLGTGGLRRPGHGHRPQPLSGGAGRRRLAAAEGRQQPHDLPRRRHPQPELADGAFDAVIAHTLLSHVDRPLAVLQEAARVTRPGGLIAIFDGDYASITFALEDPERTEAHDRKFIAGIITSPHVMRQMPRLLRQAGLELVKTFSYVMADIGKADFWLSAVEAFSKLLPKSGAMTEEEAKGWETSLKRASDEGVFFAASNYYTYVARRS